MDLGLEALTNASAAGRDHHRPEFFRLSHPEDGARLHELLKRTPGIRVFDELHSQLTELVRALNPSVKFSPKELNEAARAHLGATPGDAYGVWVFHPWADRLVHLLDEVEFRLVRTDRNRNKITREEQALLETRRIGVIGLSVGQSICLTLASERSFGELRIADFDVLELSNLNRIRTGTQNMGLRKTVIVAREIAELDPFLNVTLFNEGITRDNIDAFLTQGGRLHALVDECDAVDVKIYSRQKAKALGIPVLMDTSDRGMIDVERFDLEPDRPILHGLIGHLDPNDAAKARTNEEKLPFVLPIAGIDTLSKRMKASMLEIESSVTTWPQLASSVVLGGALGADTLRRMALGQFTASGRWFVDTEELLPGTPASTRNLRQGTLVDPLSTDSMQALAKRAMPVSSDEGFTRNQVEEMVSAAALAPSAGNLQPWRFLFHERKLFIFHDGSIGDSRLDGGRLIPAIDMGTCLENIRLRAAELAVGVEITPFPIADDHRLVAVIGARTESLALDDLATLIPKRCTNRLKGDARVLPQAVTHRLIEAAEGVKGSTAHVLADRNDLTRAAELIATAERIRVLNPIGHHELFHHELRWGAPNGTPPLEGLDLSTLELKPSEEVAMRVARDSDTMGLLATWDAGRGFAKLTREAFRSASGVVLVTAPDTSPLGYLEAGRAMQRVWLAATGAGWAVHPCAAPILLAHHVRFGGGVGLSDTHRHELLRLWDEVRALFGITNSEPAFMMRLSFAGAPTVRSLRRPISDLLYELEPTTA